MSKKIFYLLPVFCLAILMCCVSLKSDDTNVYADVGSTVLNQVGGSYDSVNNTFVSGNSSSYLVLSEGMSSVNSHFEIDLSLTFKNTSNTTYYEIFGWSQSNAYTPEFMFNGSSFMLQCYYDNSSHNICTQLICPFSPVNNTKYYFKLIYNGFFYLSYSFDGLTYYTLSTTSGGLSLPNFNTPLMFMNFYSGDRYSDCVLNLNDLYIYSNDKLWYAGSWFKQSNFYRSELGDSNVSGIYTLTEVNSAYNKIHYKYNFRFAPTSTTNFFRFYASSLATGQYSYFNMPLKFSFTDSSGNTVSYIVVITIESGSGYFNVNNVSSTRMISFSGGNSYYIYFDFIFEKTFSNVSYFTDLKINKGLYLTNFMYCPVFDFLFNQANLTSDILLNTYCSNFVSNSSYVSYNLYRGAYTITKYYSSVTPSWSYESSLGSGWTTDNNLRFYKNNQYITNAYVILSSLYYDSIYFDIDANSYLVNNSLVISNFDNLLVSSLNNAYFSMLLGEDEYFITSFNARGISFVDNNQISYLYNTDLKNIMFDKYIRFGLSGCPVNSAGIYYSFDYSDYNEFGLYDIDFGFDFNFQKYLQPLVASNGVYSLDVQYPQYVDTPWKFSLVPPEFYIPFKEIFYNFFIFILFYCPVISDILQWFHFTEFFGSLNNIFGLFLDSSLGVFIFSLVAFFILFSIIKSWLPGSFGAWSVAYIGSSTDSIKSDMKMVKDNKNKAKEENKKLNLLIRRNKTKTILKGKSVVYKRGIKNLKGRSRVRPAKRVRQSFNVSKPKYASREDIIRIAKENGQNW